MAKSVEELINEHKRYHQLKAVPIKKSTLVPYDELLKQKVPAVITERCNAKWLDNDHTLEEGTYLYFVTHAGPFGRDRVTKKVGVYMQALVWGAATMHSMASVPRECVRVLSEAEFAEVKDQFVTC